VASLSQGRTAAAQCGLFTHKSVPVIFEPPCIWQCSVLWQWRFNLLAQFINTVSKTGFYIWSQYLKNYTVFCQGVFTASLTRNVVNRIIISQKGNW